MKEHVVFENYDMQCKKAQMLLGVLVDSVVFNVYDRNYYVFTKAGARIVLGIWFGETPFNVVASWPRLLQHK